MDPPPASPPPATAAGTSRALHSPGTTRRIVRASHSFQEHNAVKYTDEVYPHGRRNPDSDPRPSVTNVRPPSVRPATRLLSSSPRRHLASLPRRTSSSPAQPAANDPIVQSAGQRRHPQPRATPAPHLRKQPGHSGLRRALRSMWITTLAP